MKIYTIAEKKLKDWAEALTDAIHRNSEKDVEALLKAGMDINIGIDRGEPALMMATRRCCDASIIKMLLDAGAEVNACRYGSTALHWAYGCKDPEIVKILVDAGADVNARDWQGETPLIWASHINFSKAIQPLIQAGADVNIRDRVWDQSALSMAAGLSCPDVIKMLLDAGAEANVQYSKGWTALMNAAYNSIYPENIRLLLDAGADPSLKNEDGKTALQIAQTRESKMAGTSEIIKMLSNALERKNEKEKKQNESSKCQDG